MLKMEIHWDKTNLSRQYHWGLFKEGGGVIL